MKKFFEEYGFTILASIIVIILIVMATPIGNSIQTNISNVVNSLKDKTTQKLEKQTILYPKEIIRIDNKEYIVIKHLEENSYLLMGPKLESTIVFNYCKEHNETECVKEDNNYLNSNVDNYLNNDYYNSLSFKGSIFSQEIDQKIFTEENFIKNKDFPVPSIKGEPGLYKFEGVANATRSIGSYKVFLPSIEELNQIVNVNDSKEMGDFLNSDNPETEYRILLRDVINTQNEPKNSLVINAGPASRSLNWAHANSDITSVRPVFAIDLTNVYFEIVGNLE